MGLFAMNIFRPVPISSQHPSKYSLMRRNGQAEVNIYMEAFKVNPAPGSG